MNAMHPFKSERKKLKGIIQACVESLLMPKDCLPIVGGRNHWWWL
jgi:hypothetical protein